MSRDIPLHIHKDSEENSSPEATRSPNPGDLARIIAAKRAVTSDIALGGTERSVDRADLARQLGEGLEGRATTDRLEVRAGPSTADLARQLREGLEGRPATDRLEVRIVLPTPADLAHQWKEGLEGTIGVKVRGVETAMRALIRGILTEAVDPKKAVAAAEGGMMTISGWTKREGFTQATNEVMKLCREIGHEPRPHKLFDQGQPGRYNSSHAEKQLSVAAPNEPMAVSIPMCSDCKPYFQKLARFTNEAQVVADPDKIRIFHPDGSIISLPNELQIDL